MITINGFVLVHSSTFIIQDRALARVQIKVADQDVAFEITFDPAPGFASAMTWSSRGDTVVLVFKGWTTPAGGFGQPQMIGDVNGERLYVQMSHFKWNVLDPAHLVNFFVLTKGLAG